MSGVQVPVDTRRLLVDRVVASRYIGKSTRLRSLLLYLCDQVLEHNATDIHEQGVGRAVFGRPPDYDTVSDNIVRVNASMLRKRLEQYFSAEGRDEPVIIELPKGNYAPVFSERKTNLLFPADVPEAVLESDTPVRGPAPPPTAGTPSSAARYTLWLFVGLTVIFGGLNLFLLREGNPPVARTPGVTRFRHGLWSQLFAAAQQTDIVLDDEGVGLYQELTGAPVGLSDYFNRNYLRSLSAGAARGGVPQEVLGSIVLKRQSGYGSATLLWKLGSIAGESHTAANIHFARDYSFRELQRNNAILLGSAVSNPWIEAFQEHLGLRWKYEPSRGAYYPVDKPAAGSLEDRFRTTGDGYAMIALVPNLSGTGTVLILTSSGGSALNAAGDFLADNECVTRLESMLPAPQRGKLRYLEALLRVKSRSRLPRDISIVICREPRF